MLEDWGNFLLVSRTWSRQATDIRCQGLGSITAAEQFKHFAFVIFSKGSKIARLPARRNQMGMFRLHTSAHLHAIEYRLIRPDRRPWSMPVYSQMRRSRCVSTVLSQHSVVRLTFD